MVLHLLLVQLILAVVLANNEINVEYAVVMDKLMSVASAYLLVVQTSTNPVLTVLERHMDQNSGMLAVSVAEQAVSTNVVAVIKLMIPEELTMEATMLAVYACVMMTLISIAHVLAVIIPQVL
jgi:hypothetical protein